MERNRIRSTEPWVPDQILNASVLLLATASHSDSSGRQIPNHGSSEGECYRQSTPDSLAEREQVGEQEGKGVEGRVC